MNKPWYKTPIGVVVAVLLFPFFLPWYAWAKSQWSKNVKIAITIFCLFFIIIVSVTPSPKKENQSDTIQTNNQNDSTQNKSERIKDTNNADNKPEEIKVDENDPSIVIPSVFVGNYSWSQIQPKLHSLIVASGEPNPESKYMNVANATFTLRKSSTRKDLTEMMIIDRALSYYVALSSTESKMSLPDALALATVELEVE